MQIHKFFALLLLFSSFLGIGCQKEHDSPCEQIVDSRDGEIYSVVKIGDQCWMAENLRYNAVGSTCNPDNPASIYGRLYNWETLMNGEASSDNHPSGVKGICPEGWHLPSYSEWNALEIALGLSVEDLIASSFRGTHGIELKSTTGWSPIVSSYGYQFDTNGTNSFCFNAFPAGRYLAGNYHHLGKMAFFASSTENNPATSSTFKGRTMSYYEDGVGNSSLAKVYSVSCRCVKD